METGKTGDHGGSKTALQRSMRKSKDSKTKITGSERRSQYGSTSTRKKRRRSSGLDEASLKKISDMDVRIEDLRKESFKEINRLEAFAEKQNES